MKFLIIILLATFSIQTWAESPCDNNNIFKVRGGADYSNMFNTFLANGGRTPDIVKVDSTSVILEQFSAYSFPDGFEYRGRTRNQWGYKFAVSQDCELNVSFYEYKHRRDPNHLNRDIHHHLVAKGNHVYTAGAIFFFHDGREIEKVVFSNRSSRFCPSLQSREIVKQLLVKAGVDQNKIQLAEDTRCVPNPLPSP